MEKDLMYFFGSALITYNNSNKKYKKYINQFNIINNNNTDYILENIKSSEHLIIYYSEVIAIFYEKTNIFIWGWVIPNRENLFSKHVINYGLSINDFSSNQTYIRSLILNSRIKINNNTQLTLLLATVYYLLKSTCDFIYPQKIYDSNGNLSYTLFRAIKISKQ